MMYHTAEPRITFEDEPDARTLRGLKGDNGKRYTELKVPQMAIGGRVPSCGPADF